MDDDLIVFESGQGRHFSDSPRYVYEELVRRGDTRTKVWVYDRPLPVRDEHTIVVKRHSFGFYWYLARAKFWVNNHTFPHYITRRPKGQYVQTWHGTPLKRMFLDQEAWFGRDPGYKDRVTEAVAQWSVLVSPSPYATECMAHRLRLEGPGRRGRLPAQRHPARRVGRRPGRPGAPDARHRTRQAGRAVRPDLPRRPAHHAWPLRVHHADRPRRVPPPVRRGPRAAGAHPRADQQPGRGAGRGPRRASSTCRPTPTSRSCSSPATCW